MRLKNDRKYWKATEFRQFLLYDGPIVLKGVVSKLVYDHFMALHVAMDILLNDNDEKRNFYVDYSRHLLQWFVDNAKRVYGRTFTVYNVHSIVHLPDDVINYSCSLNELSAFKFENHMQKLKKKVRNSNNPIVQIIKRE